MKQQTFRRSTAGGAAVLALALLPSAASAATPIDTITSWNGSENALTFGASGTHVYGQTITATSSASLRQFEFEMNLPSSVVFRGEVYAWDGQKAVGPALYESAPRSTSGSGAYERVTFDTGAVPLTAGQQYVLFASTDRDPGSGSGRWGAQRTQNPYAGGTFVYINSQSPADWTGSPWEGNGGIYGANADLAFTATFGGLTTAPATDFGTQATGTVGAARTITVTNSDDSPSTVQRPRLSGTDADDFLITRDDCQGVTLAVGDSCTIRVRFAPSDAGNRTATLAVQGSVNTASSALTGVGGPLPTGPTGPAGATGPTGADGATGPTGATGADGATGPVGATGNDGATGAAGPVGPQGPVGSAGVAGPDGAVGPTGPVGPQGTAGTNGAAGPAGPKGDQGVAGPPGPRGPVGLRGPRGAKGASAPIAVYKCQRRRGNGRFPIACFVDVLSNPASSRTRSVTVRVRRSSGRLYAAGSRTLTGRQTRVPVTGALVAKAGRYSIITTIRTATGTQTLRGSFTIPAG